MREQRSVPLLRNPGGSDIRPTVGRASGLSSFWIFGGAALLLAVLLFGFLDSRRRALSAPSTATRIVDQAGTVSALPPLAFPFVPPPPPVPTESELVGPVPAMMVPAGSPPSVPAQPAPQAQYVPRPPSPPVQSYSPPQAMPPQAAAPDVRRPFSPSSRGVLVIDAGADTALETDRGGPAEQGSQTPPSRESARSGFLRRRAATVPEGTLIPAVLETALDSSRPGFARAIVSSDVTGFDGSRVLIPRGSRLLGAYQTELGAGQNRATVQWTRLVRPDGVTIALDSPAADPAGRAGVQGQVNNRYFERFAGALLRTTLNAGAILAGRELAGGAVIVGLPASTQGGAASPSESAVRPTLRVEAGTRVSVLVARDLEFASGARRQ